jgi:hypothetical protein
MRFSRFFAFTLVLVAASVASAESVSIFNTGVDASGNPLSDGTIGDPHYSLVSVPSGSTTDIQVLTSAGGYPIPPYIGDDSESAWIGPANDSINDGPVGVYDFQTTFFAPSAGSVDLAGNWSVDNEGFGINLNGVSTGNVNFNGFTTFTSFAIDSTVNAGLNTLDFLVNNDGGPIDLRVEFSGTSFTPSFTSSGVPEISAGGLGSLVMVLMGLLALMEAGRAKARRA